MNRSPDDPDVESLSPFPKGIKYKTAKAKIEYRKKRKKKNKIVVKSRKRNR